VRVFDARLERFFHVVCADLDGVTRVTKVSAGGVAIWGHNIQLTGLQNAQHLVGSCRAPCNVSY